MTTVKGLKLLGKGAFTKCYLNTCETSVTLISCDPVKECMSNGWFPESELFPTVEYVDTCEQSSNNIYTMEYFPRTKGLKNVLDADQWEIYKTLRDVMSNIKYCLNIYDSYSNTLEAFESIENDELRWTMVEALDACSNYGSDVGFEISPRNVAVKNGKLILLDCFFMKSTLQKVRGR